mmetsp:Transcript_63641/g.163818  ORF Transcript_63641/g.163818 Transcript_63641/m.163818 type:complete len:249 (-) Transcript_63641:92-838(-)
MPPECSRRHPAVAPARGRLVFRGGDQGDGGGLGRRPRHGRYAHRSRPAATHSRQGLAHAAHVHRRLLGLRLPGRQGAAHALAGRRFAGGRQGRGACCRRRQRGPPRLRRRRAGRHRRGCPLGQPGWRPGAVPRRGCLRGHAGGLSAARRHAAAAALGQDSRCALTPRLAGGLHGRLHVVYLGAGLREAVTLTAPSRRPTLQLADRRGRATESRRRRARGARRECDRPTWPSTRFAPTACLTFVVNHDK